MQLFFSFVLLRLCPMHLFLGFTNEAIVPETLPSSLQNLPMRVVQTLLDRKVCVCACVRFFSRVPSLRPFDAELHCLAEPQEIEREDQAERQRESRRTPGLSGTRHTEMNSPGVTRGRRGARRARGSAWWQRSRS